MSWSDTVLFGLNLYDTSHLYDGKTKPVDLMASWISDLWNASVSEADAESGLDWSQQGRLWLWLRGTLCKYYDQYYSTVQEEDEKEEFRCFSYIGPYVSFLVYCKS